MNSFTKSLSYPLHCIDQLSTDIPRGSITFSAVEFREAYFSLPLEYKCRKYAGIITRTSAYVPSRSKFSSKIAPTVFQHTMDDILRSYRELTFVYLDDILIFSSDENQHLRHLRSVFKRLLTNGLYLNIKICVFMKNLISFLGYMINAECICHLESKVAEIN